MPTRNPHPDDDCLLPAVHMGTRRGEAEHDFPQRVTAGSIVAVGEKLQLQIPFHLRGPGALPRQWCGTRRHTLPDCRLCAARQATELYRPGQVHQHRQGAEECCQGREGKNADGGRLCLRHKNQRAHHRSASEDCRHQDSGGHRPQRCLLLRLLPPRRWQRTGELCGYADTHRTLTERDEDRTQRRHPNARQRGRHRHLPESQGELHGLGEHRQQGAAAAVPWAEPAANTEECRCQHQLLHRQHQWLQPQQPPQHQHPRQLLAAHQRGGLQLWAEEQPQHAVDHHGRLRNLALEAHGL